jgi:hypothetical protein
LAWIESHQQLINHPKTLKLASLMSWDIDTTIGKLHRFWWWCLDYAPDGNVSRHSADIVALSIGILPEKGQLLIKSLYEAGFLDKTTLNRNQTIYIVHEWLEYAGRYLRDTKYKRSPEKFQEIKDLYTNAVSRHVQPKNAKRTDMSAVPNQPNQPNQHKHILGEFRHVFLTEDEVKKLREKLNSKFDYWIKTLDEGIETRGYKYKNHYLAILKWIERDKEKGRSEYL